MNEAAILCLKPLAHPEETLQSFGNRFRESVISISHFEINTGPLQVGEPCKSLIILRSHNLRAVSNDLSNHT